MGKKLVYVLGDSISIHYGPHLRDILEGESFKYDRKRDEGIASVDLDCSAGANGGDSSNVLEFLEKQLKEGFKCDILLLNCGLHDVKIDRSTRTRQVELVQYHSNLVRSVQIAGDTAGETVWVTSTPVSDLQHSQFKKFDRYNADVERYNAAANEIMHDTGIKVIDLYSFTLKLGGPLHTDGVHFLPEISRLQAAFIAGFLYSSYSAVF